MQSLFVVSLPRSLSSFVYRVARTSLGLREPRWTEHGEILNLDQMAAYRGPRFDENAKFTTRGQDPALFERLGDFLDQVVQRGEFAYKDVTQPFVVADWLQRHELNVLRLDRPVTDVAFAMLSSRWYYPQSAALATTDREQAVIDGLLRAEQALATVAGESLSYRDLARDEQHLEACLARLYPDAIRPPIRYLDEGFVRETHRQLARRGIPSYRALDERVAAARARMSAGEGAPARERDRPHVLPPWLAERIRRQICEVLPQDAAVLIVSDGHSELLNLEGRRAWHFPNDRVAPQLPMQADPGRAPGQLDAFGQLGATHLVLPLVPGALELVPRDVADLFPQLPVAYEDDACRIFALTE